MDTTSILQELHAERDRLDRAIAALEAISSGGAILFVAKHKPAIHAAAMGQRRRMSAAGRRRISEAAKAMWARRRNEKAAPKRGTRSRMSADGRKRLSMLLKRRWAQGKMKGRRKAKVA